MQGAVWGAVLAGGESRRLGVDKCAIRWRGTTLLERAVGRLRSVAEEVVVVGRKAGAAGVEGVPDRAPGQGPLGGILTALELRPKRPVLILACDLPLVRRELLLWLLERGRRTQHQVVYPRVGRDVQPLCGLWSPAVAEEIRSSLNRGERAVDPLLRRLGEEPIELSPAESFYSPDLLANVNRWSDVASIGAVAPDGAAAVSV